MQRDLLSEDLIANDNTVRTLDGGVRQNDAAIPERPNNPVREELIHAITTAIQDRAEAGHRDFLAKLRDLDAEKQSVESCRDASQREIAYLERTLQSVDSNMATLKDRLEKAAAVTIAAESTPEPDVDSVVVATTVVHDQLYDLVSDELAIDDTVFVLSRAFEDGQIQLDVFLKHLRLLTREQFLKRVHIAKISRKLGLQQG